MSETNNKPQELTEEEIMDANGGSLKKRNVIVDKSIL